MSFSGAVGGATTGFKVGAATGVPHLAGIGAAVGGIAGIFGGGGGGEKDHAANQAKRAAKYARKMHKYDWKESQRAYDYQVETQKIQKRNTEKNLDYQDESNKRNYDHNMAIRSYDFKQANRAYDQSVATANDQLGFNEQAAAFAKMQQERAHGEQLIELLFSENQSLMGYSIATAGIATKRRQIGLEERKMMGKAQNDTQRSFVEELEAEGAAQASGSGRSNAKAMQAAIAKAGANQAAIADELMFGLQGLDSSTLELKDRAAAMKAQLSIDQLMLEATRDNLDARTANIMRKIAMDKEQADANARARIHLLPEMSPAMPKPLTLPRPKYQDVYKPKKPPKPKKFTGYTPSSGGFGSAMSSLAAATPSIVNAFKGGGYQPNQSIGGQNLGNGFFDSGSYSNFGSSGIDTSLLNFGSSSFNTGDFNFTNLPNYGL